MNNRPESIAEASSDWTANHAPETENERDAGAMARLAAGQDEGLNDLMERHGKRVYHFLLRALQNPEDAADLTQETFVRVYQNRCRYDPARKFTSWLYTIAANLVRDRFRWRIRHPQVSLENEPAGKAHFQCFGETGPSASELMKDKERASAVRRAVAALPKAQRVPLVLSEYEGKSHAEIGQILGCSAKAVEVRIYRARQQLRASLSHLMETE